MIADKPLPSPSGSRPDTLTDMVFLSLRGAVMSVDRGLIRWVLIIAALVFGALWFLATVASGFSVPGWVPPTGLLCLVVAVAMP